MGSAALHEGMHGARPPACAMARRRLGATSSTTPSRSPPVKSQSALSDVRQYRERMVKVHTATAWATADPLRGHASPLRKKYNDSEELTAPSRAMAK